MNLLASEQTVRIIKSYGIWKKIHSKITLTNIANPNVHVAGAWQAKTPVSSIWWVAILLWRMAGLIFPSGSTRVIPNRMSCSSVRKSHLNSNNNIANYIVGMSLSEWQITNQNRECRNCMLFPWQRKFLANWIT